MAPITRRTFIELAALFGASAAWGTPFSKLSTVAWRERRDLYPEGVASGDPDSNSVLLWTRRGQASENRVQKLTLEVAEDESFRQVIATKAVPISEASDWTCRVLVGGLKPAHVYWYRFTDSEGLGSRIGRTITAPADDDPRPARFAFVSCQNANAAAMNAYRRMIFEDERASEQERLGFVLHLGDFIYELVWYPEDRSAYYDRRIREIVRYAHGEKIEDFHIPTTLEDYRAVYRAYLHDPDLQDARARFPFVPMWDNHEFSWQGYQSQQVFFGETFPAQTKKVAASQAWFEYQPARIVQAGAQSLERFHAPLVHDAALTRFDSLGTGLEPNNLTAIHALKVYRALKWGRNADLILTDNRSFMGAQPPSDGLPDVTGFPEFYPEEALEILDGGRDYNDGNPPATISLGGHDIPNPAKDAPRQSYLGVEQKAWLHAQLRGSRKPWKIWGHSFGTLRFRADVQNLPAPLRANWPGAGYGGIRLGYEIDHGEIADLLKREGITGLAIVAGDRHSFWAGTFSKHVPPKPFEPVAVEFIGGSVIAVGAAEGLEGMRRDHPLRALYVHDSPNGPDGHKFNVTVRHGVRSALELERTGDEAAARALSN